MAAMSRAARKAMSDKIRQLAKEKYDNPKQRVAIAYSEYRKGGVKRLKQSHGGKVSGRKRRAA